MDLVTSILFATIVAGTPLIIVALGQLIAEKSGVLNLGAEGMMSMGAIAGFAVTLHSGKRLARRVGRHGGRRGDVVPVRGGRADADG